MHSPRGAPSSNERPNALKCDSEWQSPQHPEDRSKSDPLCLSLRESESPKPAPDKRAEIGPEPSLRVNLRHSGLERVLSLGKQGLTFLSFAEQFSNEPWDNLLPFP